MILYTIQAHKLHGKSWGCSKTRALERLAMYRIPGKEAEFKKCDMVFGGKLNRQNRWVVLAKEDKIVA
jgi:hypothetical protein